MPSADQVPINFPHSTMLGGSWVVLIAGSTGSALRAVRPPNLHITPVARRDLVYRASAAGCFNNAPAHTTFNPLRAILLASAMAAIFAGRRPNNDEFPARRPLGAAVAGAVSASAPATNRLRRY